MTKRLECSAGDPTIPATLTSCSVQPTALARTSNLPLFARLRFELFFVGDDVLRDHQPSQGVVQRRRADRLNDDRGYFWSAAKLQL